MVLAVFVVIMLGIHFALDPRDGFVVPNCLNHQLYALILQTVLAVVALIFFTVKLWNVRDGFYIKVEMVAVLVGAPLLFILFCVFFIVDITTVTNTFLVLGPLYVSLVTSVFPVVMSFRNWSVEQDPEVDAAITGWGSSSSRKTSDEERREATVTQEDIFRLFLRNPQAVEGFRRFCVELWCAENLAFYLEVEDFKELEDPERLRKEAQEVVQRFLKPGSPMQVNIEETRLKETLERVQSAVFDSSVFNRCQDAVFKVMYEDTFAKWRRRREFEETLHLPRRSRNGSGFLLEMFSSSPRVSSQKSQEFFRRESSPEELSASSPSGSPQMRQTRD